MPTLRPIALLLAALSLAVCDDGPTGLEPRDLPRATVAAGTDHACALDADGEAWCWGSNRFGQLGAPDVDLFSWTPVAVSGGRSYVSIAAATPNEVFGAFATCALTAAGEAYCWGRNSGGLISESDETECSGVVGDTHYLYPCVRAPRRVAPALRFAQLSVGADFICGVTESGEAWCWGAGDRGQLGDGTFESSAEPVRVAGGHRFAMVAAGDDHACALDSDGGVWCWGDDTQGQLGGGTTGTRSGEPVQVSWERSFRRIDAGDTHTCGVDAGGSMVCWGQAAGLRLGRFPTPTEPARGPLALEGSTDFVAVSAGVGTACGVARQGTTICWGALSNDAGETPAAVPSASFEQVSVGFVHGCGRWDGDVWCWGDNEFPGPGQLGVGDDVSASETPLRVTF